MAASNRELDAASLAPNPQAAGGRTGFGAVRTLRLLLIGSVVLPLLAGSVAGYYSYRASYQRAAVALAEAAAVAEENTTKILDTHLMAAGRIDDLLQGLSDPEILARNKRCTTGWRNRSRMCRRSRRLGSSARTGARWSARGSFRSTGNSTIPGAKTFARCGSRERRRSSGLCARAAWRPGNFSRISP